MDIDVCLIHVILSSIEEYDFRSISRSMLSFVQVELLSRLHSPYLLALLGYCSDHNHKLLVYDFMANGGLQEHLYPLSSE